MFCLQKNNLYFIIFLILLWILSACMPHGITEIHEYHDFKGLFRQISNSLKPITLLKRILNTLKIFLFRINKVLLTIAEKIKTQFVLFNLRLFTIGILQISPFLYCHFFTSKYKKVCY